MNTARRSGSTNRTSFMYTLDRLGYRGYYDVYDVQGFGNTNNDLGGRASLAQIAGYALIVHDAGRSALAPIPNGSDLGTQKINQAQQYANYLAQGGPGFAESASLWVIGENWAFETTHGNSSSDLVVAKLGLSSQVVDSHSFGPNPLVEGNSAFAFAGGSVQSFADQRLRLAGGCPSARTYDRLATSGNGIVTHVYKDLPTGLEEPAIVMNKSSSEHWNAISMAFNWFDAYDVSGVTPNATRQELALRILNGVLPVNCIRSANETDVPPDEEVADLLPRKTALHQNAPNPFNPTTIIRFDLAQDGHVKLRVFDVAGRVLRTLVDEKRKRQSHAVVWNGLDSDGHRVASGLYMYRLDTEGFSFTRKLVVLR